MNAIDNLLQRVSIPAKYLREPAPTDEDLRIILGAAVTAPDHAALRPWRFIFVSGTARAALGEVFAEAFGRRDPDAAAEQRQRQREKPMRSPLLIVVVAHVTLNHPKVPKLEQLLSAGAAAEHIQLAARALGYGSVWVTGPNAVDEHVRRALGVEEPDQIVGFLHIGTPSIQVPVVKRPNPMLFVERWTETS